MYAGPAHERVSYKEVPIISVPDYKWPQNDYAMLLQSHVDGE